MMKVPRSPDRSTLAMLLLGLIGGLALTMQAAPTSYTDAPTQFLDINGRKLAYRTVGAGRPLVLCLRFRGILDSWDPAFVDGLAKEFRVIAFDHSGLGRSTGEPSSSSFAMAHDIRDVIEGMKLTNVVLCGWSLGGLVAQLYTMEYPERVGHLVLIGTGPVGKNEFPMKPIFLERAHREVNDLDDEEVLFFEPRSAVSREAARASHERIARRTEDRDVPIPPALWAGLHQAGAELAADKFGTRAKLQTTQIPILVLCGDHDIVFPVENWYALTRQLPTMQLVVFPQSGHGPQHQYIDASVDYITAFARTAR